MRSLNTISLIGNVGKDPEIRFTKTGEPIANFTVATSESWKDAAGQKVEKTEWHRLEVFGALAQIARDFVKKGKPVYVQGKIRYDEYVDKEGVKRNVTKIVLSGFDSKLILLSSKPPAEEAAEDLSVPSPTSTSIAPAPRPGLLAHLGALMFGLAVASRHRSH